jgi:hypothetical protein
MFAPPTANLVFCAGLMGVALPLAIPEEFGTFARPAVWAASIAVGLGALAKAWSLAHEREWLARLMMAAIWARTRSRNRRRVPVRSGIGKPKESPSLRPNY